MSECTVEGEFKAYAIRFELRRAMLSLNTDLIIATAHESIRAGTGISPQPVGAVGTYSAIHSRTLVDFYTGRVDAAALPVIRTLACKRANHVFTFRLPAACHSLAFVNLGAHGVVAALEPTGGAVAEVVVEPVEAAGRATAEDVLALVNVDASLVVPAALIPRRALASEHVRAVKTLRPTAAVDIFALVDVYEMIQKEVRQMG